MIYVKNSTLKDAMKGLFNFFLRVINSFFIGIRNPDSKIRIRAFDLFWSTFKLALLAILITILGSTYIGNWIQCKFIDTRGCLPKPVLEIRATKLDKFDYKFLCDKYGDIDLKADDLPHYTLVEYRIAIKNKGYENIDNLLLRVKPLINWPLIGSRILGPVINTSLSNRKESSENVIDPEITIKGSIGEVKIKSEHFHVSTSWLTLEQAILEVAIAYPKDDFDSWTKPLLIVEAACEHCQIRFVKKILYKAG